MSMNSLRSLFITGTLAASLAGCASAPKAFQPLDVIEAEAVRAECGLILPASRLKSGGDFRRRAYQTCKSDVLRELARNE